jgi:hypothetical protein
MKRLIRNEKADAYLTEDISVKNGIILISKQLGVYGIIALLILGCHTLTHAKEHHPVLTATDATCKSSQADREITTQEAGAITTHEDQDATHKETRPDDGITTLPEPRSE